MGELEYSRLQSAIKRRLNYAIHLSSSPLSSFIGRSVEGDKSYGADGTYRNHVMFQQEISQRLGSGKGGCERR